MARKLDILVPVYKEDESVVKCLLDSIAIQQGIDFADVGVIICCDGGTTRLSQEFIDRYPFAIEFYVCEHRGVSATRNECFEHSTADYVAWCDADDCYYSVCALYLIFREIDDLGGFDSLTSLFIEENRDPNTHKPIYINREMDSTFVHGKVHRRQYLLDNNIRWNPALTIHEDSYFNILCQNLSDKVKYSPTPFYLWKWRDDSVCRHDPKYILKTYTNLIDSNTALVDEFAKRGLVDKARFYITFMIFDAYYTMNKPEWINQENKEYRDKTEKRFAEYFIKYEADWNATPYTTKMQVSNGVRTRSVNEGMMMESVTVDDWLKKVKKLIKRGK